MHSSQITLSLVSSVVLAFTSLVHAQPSDPTIVKTESEPFAASRKAASSVGRAFLRLHPPRTNSVGVCPSRQSRGRGCEMPASSASLHAGRRCTEI